MSATNASTSSGVGGRPVRSKVDAGGSACAGRPAATGVSPFASSFGQDEAIDRRLAAASVLDRRQRPACGPAGTPSASCQASADVEPPSPRRAAAGHGAPILTQAVSVGDGLGRQLALGRHLDVALVADRLDQQALVGLAGDDDRAGVAALRAAPRASRAAAPPAVVFGPWQVKQFSASTGRTFVSKNSACWAEGLPSSASTGVPKDRTSTDDERRVQVGEVSAQDCSIRYGWGRLWRAGEVPLNLPRRRHPDNDKSWPILRFSIFLGDVSQSLTAPDECTIMHRSPIDCAHTKAQRN